MYDRHVSVAINNTHDDDNTTTVPTQGFTVITNGFYFRIHVIDQCLTTACCPQGSQMSKYLVVTRHNFKPHLNKHLKNKYQSRI